MLGGQPPKPEGERISRTQQVHEWIDVQNVPFRGKRPSLPKELGAATRSWWRVISAMPHCARWTGDDWAFALDTAIVHDRFSRGVSGADAELRRRGDVLGITGPARRNLRIRYIDIQAGEATAPVDSDVADFAEARKKKLLGAG